MDPRRLGHGDNSGLSDEDLADIVCIIHPATESAIEATQAIMETYPDLAVSRPNTPVKVRAGNPQPVAPGTFELAAKGLHSKDIAIRLSTKLKDPTAGFVFGRHSDRCDFPMTLRGKRAAKVSNRHFRIYVTKHNVVMLEDTSRNGTTVDNQKLESVAKENGAHFRKMLIHGSMISIDIAPETPMMFIVRIPNRSEYAEQLYEHNLQAYFARLDEAHARAQQALLKQANGAAGQMAPPDIFAVQNVSTTTISRNRAWKGGNKYNVGEKVGNGAFATVFKVFNKFDGTPMAAKEIEKRKFIRNGVLDVKVESEMKIMKSIKHVSSASQSLSDIF
jgi:hypothetical protein